MTKVLFLISALSSGGAARVLTLLANHFSARPDYRVSVVTHVRGAGYSVSETVDWMALFEPAEIKGTLVNKIWRRLVYWPRLISSISRSRPDVVVVFLRGMNWRGIAACRLLRVRVVVTEHTNHLAETGFWSWVERRLSYKLANHLVVLSEFDREHYARYLQNVSLVPNPRSFDSSETVVERAPIILGVGDLDRWRIKGFDTLIEIFARLAGAFPEWRLRLVGPGVDGLSELEHRAVAAGVADRVEFPGFSRNIDLEMQRSEVFALTSRHEGFAMVLLEAMSQGCACISFDCNSGPADLLARGECGLLVPDQDANAMEAGLRLLMGSESLRAQFGRAGVRNSANYSFEKIAPMWTAIFADSASRRSDASRFLQ